MKFEELKIVLKQLEEKGYIGARIHKDHIMICIKIQTNNFTEEITNKMYKIFKALEDCYYQRVWGETRYILVIDAKRFITALEKGEKYEKIVNNIEDAKISYIRSAYVDGKGVDKKIEIYYTNHEYCGKDFKDSLTSILKSTLPSNMEMKNKRYFTTKKATDYERKKKCCQSIKIEEDFDEIFEKYL